MFNNSNRINREKKTVKAMMHIYCKAHHATSNTLCNTCFEILEYSIARLDKCPYEIKKPVCDRCKTHCYKPDMREEIKQVMRYAGPKMTWAHPVLSIFHLIYKIQK